VENVNNHVRRIEKCFEREATILSSIFEEDDSRSQGDVPAPTWTLRDLVVGLAALSMLRVLGFVPYEWFASVPFWVRVVLGFLLPQLFLFAYPIFLARRRHFTNRFRWPDLEKVVVEGAISLPVIITVLAVLVCAGFVVKKVSPQTSLASNVIERAALAQNVSFVIVFAVLAVTVAPLCEEVFFRGFLHNALRSRIRVVPAAIVQSLIFALLHTFGTMHSIFVFFLGLTLTGVYEWRKSLVTPIAVHTGVNLIASLGLIAVMIASANSPVLGVFGRDHPLGCQVDKVVPDSAAAKAHIVEGDMITDLDGERITSFNQMADMVRQHQVGDKVTVGITRDGDHFEVEAVLEKRP